MCMYAYEAAPLLCGRTVLYMRKLGGSPFHPWKKAAMLIGGIAPGESLSCSSIGNGSSVVASHISTHMGIPLHFRCRTDLSVCFFCAKYPLSSKPRPNLEKVPRDEKGFA